MELKKVREKKEEGKEEERKCKKRAKYREREKIEMIRKKKEKRV